VAAGWTIDIDEGEIVRKVKLEIWAVTAEA
jgi:hypothetical protein